jgi:Mg-chelatase subunit ChlD
MVTNQRQNQPSTPRTVRHNFRKALVGVWISGLLLLNACSPAMMPAAAPSSASAGEAAAAESARPVVGGAAPSGAPAPYSSSHTTQYEAVTAGVTDDNANWPEYLDYRARHRGLWVNDRDISERHIIQVVDDEGRPVHDAIVTITAGDQEVMMARSDAGGRVLFHPAALDKGYWLRQTGEVRVEARKGYVAQRQTFARSDDGLWTLTLTEPSTAGRTQLDLLFLIDATGSMGDEIEKLKASMAEVAGQIATLPEQPDVRYGLVAYRDRGDEFVVRPYDFTYDLREFQRNLAWLRADGGGDTPESLNEALHVAIHNLSWRNEETVRLVLLVADAPPHLDYGEPFSYDTDMIEAVRRGIKLFPIGASNLDQTGEYIFRQLAQFTGGKFVFLTYKDGSDPSSGPGTETEHDVENYSVDTLDRLVVRLVREELAKLTTPVTQAQMTQPPSPRPTPTPVYPLVCMVAIDTARTDCTANGALLVTSIGSHTANVQVILDPVTTGYDRARFDIRYRQQVAGTTALISGDNNDAAQLHVIDGALLVFGVEDMPAHLALDGDRLLYKLDDLVHPGETIGLEVSDGRLGINYAGGIEVVESPYLLFFGQYDLDGTPDLHIFLNGQSANAQGGADPDQVVVTLYPAR